MKNVLLGTFWWSSSLPMWGFQVQSLVGELGFHMPFGMTTKFEIKNE